MTMDADLLFPRMAEASLERNLRLMVIGGHAVNSYGYSRTTLDADFLIPENDLPRWREILESWGFLWAMQSSAFAKFKFEALTPDAYTLDLMIVAPPTFEKMWAEHQDRHFGPALLSVPDPLHLIALKLHAMKQAERFKKGKDLPDIMHLIRICGIDTNSSEFQNILKQYANQEIKQLLQPFLHSE